MSCRSTEFLTARMLTWWTYLLGMSLWILFRPGDFLSPPVNTVILATPEVTITFAAFVTTTLLVVSLYFAINATYEWLERVI